MGSRILHDMRFVMEVKRIGFEILVNHDLANEASILEHGSWLPLFGGRHGGLVGNR